MDDPFLYKQLLRPLLFSLPPETAHELTLRGIRTLGNTRFFRNWSRRNFALQYGDLHRELFGLDLPSPIGVAAGLDKNAIAYEGLGSFGFGFVEVGTVTPKPQKGNPKPRLFRLPKDRALINRMGFNNEGAERVAERLKGRSEGLIVGANIGKNKETPNEKAYEDLAFCFQKLHPHADYLVVNVSSPNTPGLRELQEKDALRDLLERLLELRESLEGSPRPLLLKLAPDLGAEALDEAVEVALNTGIDGLIATNTSVSREGLRTSSQELERIGGGGLSGAPLLDRSTEVIRRIKKQSQGRLPVIGVGGILSSADAQAKLDAGADLLQVYTGLIYEGPAFAKRILRGMQG